MTSGQLKNRMSAVDSGKDSSRRQVGSVPDVSTHQPALIKRMVAEDAMQKNFYHRFGVAA